MTELLFSIGNAVATGNSTPSPGAPPPSGGPDFGAMLQRIANSLRTPNSTQISSDSPINTLLGSYSSSLSAVSGALHSGTVQPVSADVAALLQRLAAGGAQTDGKNPGDDKVYALLAKIAAGQETGKTATTGALAVPAQDAQQAGEVSEEDLKQLYDVLSSLVSAFLVAPTQAPPSTGGEQTGDSGTAEDHPAETGVQSSLIAVPALFPMDIDAVPADVPDIPKLIGNEQVVGLPGEQKAVTEQGNAEVKIPVAVNTSGQTNTHLVLEQSAEMRAPAVEYNSGQAPADGGKTQTPVVADPASAVPAPMAQTPTPAPTPGQAQMPVVHSASTPQAAVATPPNGNQSSGNGQPELPTFNIELPGVGTVTLRLRPVENALQAEILLPPAVSNSPASVVPAITATLNSIAVQVAPQQMQQAEVANANAAVPSGIPQMPPAADVPVVETEVSVVDSPAPVNTEEPKIVNILSVSPKGSGVLGEMPSDKNGFSPIPTVDSGDAVIPPAMPLSTKTAYTNSSEVSSAEKSVSENMTVPNAVAATPAPVAAEQNSELPSEEAPKTVVHNVPAQPVTNTVAAEFASLVFAVNPEKTELVKEEKPHAGVSSTLEKAAVVIPAQPALVHDGKEPVRVPSVPLSALQNISLPVDENGQLNIKSIVFLTSMPSQAERQAVNETTMAGVPASTKSEFEAVVSGVPASTQSEPKAATFGIPATTAADNTAIKSVQTSPDIPASVEAQPSSVPVQEIPLMSVEVQRTESDLRFVASKSATPIAAAFPAAAPVLATATQAAATAVAQTLGEAVPVSSEPQRDTVVPVAASYQQPSVPVVDREPTTQPVSIPTAGKEQEVVRMWESTQENPEPSLAQARVGVPVEVVPEARVENVILPSGKQSTPQPVVAESAGAIEEQLSQSTVAPAREAVAASSIADVSEIPAAAPAVVEAPKQASGNAQDAPEPVVRQQPFLHKQAIIEQEPAHSETVSKTAAPFVAASEYASSVEAEPEIAAAVVGEKPLASPVSAQSADKANVPTEKTEQNYKPIMSGETPKAAQPGQVVQAKLADQGQAKTVASQPLVQAAPLTAVPEAIEDVHTPAVPLPTPSEPEAEVALPTVISSSTPGNVASSSTTESEKVSAEILPELPKSELKSANTAPESRKPEPVRVGSVLISDEADMQSIPVEKREPEINHKEVPSNTRASVSEPAKQPQSTVYPRAKETAPPVSSNNRHAEVAPVDAHTHSRVPERAAQQMPTQDAPSQTVATPAPEPQNTTAVPVQNPKPVEQRSTVPTRPIYSFADDVADIGTSIEEGNNVAQSPPAASGEPALVEPTIGDAKQPVVRREHSRTENIPLAAREQKADVPVGNSAQREEPIRLADREVASQPARTAVSTAAPLLSGDSAAAPDAALAVDANAALSSAQKEEQVNRALQPETAVRTGKVNPAAERHTEHSRTTAGRLTALRMSGAEPFATPTANAGAPGAVAPSTPDRNSGGQQQEKNSNEQSFAQVQALWNTITGQEQREEGSQSFSVEQPEKPRNEAPAQNKPAHETAATADGRTVFLPFHGVRNTVPPVRTYRQVAPADIPRTVQNALRTFPSGSGGFVQMTLAPDTLGEVLVSISVKEAHTEVSIHTETPDARKIVEAQLPALKEKLAQAGLQVEHIEVRSKQENIVQNEPRSWKQGGQTQEEQKSRQEFVRSFRHLASDEQREQNPVPPQRYNKAGNGYFERYA